MTKLEAINKIMRRAGLQPIRVLETDTASNGAEAERCLDDAELEMQSQGWNYNTYRDVTLSPDAMDNITVPTGTISIYPDSEYGESKNFTTRGEKLYDTDENTLLFTADVTVRYIQRWHFDCIPFPVQDYITLVAASRFNEKRGTPRIQSGIDTTAAVARVRAMQYNNKQAGTNVLNTAHSRRFRGERGEVSSP